MPMKGIALHEQLTSGFVGRCLYMYLSCATYKASASSTQPPTQTVRDLCLPYAWCTGRVTIMVTKGVALQDLPVVLQTDVSTCAALRHSAFFKQTVHDLLYRAVDHRCTGRVTIAITKTVALCEKLNSGRSCLYSSCATFNASAYMYIQRLLLVQ